MKFRIKLLFLRIRLFFLSLTGQPTRRLPPYISFDPTLAEILSKHYDQEAIRIWRSLWKPSPPELLTPPASVHKMRDRQTLQSTPEEVADFDSALQEILGPPKFRITEIPNPRDPELPLTSYLSEVETQNKEAIDLGDVNSFRLRVSDNLEIKDPKSKAALLKKQHTTR